MTYENLDAANLICKTIAELEKAQSIIEGNLYLLTKITVTDCSSSRLGEVCLPDCVSKEIGNVINTKINELKQDLERL